MQINLVINFYLLALPAKVEVKKLVILRILT